MTRKQIKKLIKNAKIGDGVVISQAIFKRWKLDKRKIYKPYNDN